MSNKKKEKLKKSVSELEQLNQKIQDDPQRPIYHFIAPARWMNDPNGPIYYKGEYHLFYQFNPFGDNWGHIHWGHAKSEDLIHWEHLPLALKPSTNEGEAHCFSGSCVIDEGIPKILYTSIGPERPPSTGAEQWLGIGDENLIHWKKYENNPVMTLDIHKKYEVRDWRDPFLWKEGNFWYAVLGGHLIKPKRPLILLYKSKDLINWEFLNPLIIEERKKGKNWECPNFFKLKNKHVLIVSPHKQVIYNVGEYKQHKFIPTEWRKLDYGRAFYATNILNDKKNERIILWGWIQGGGDIDGWNGCLSLPRGLILNSENILEIKPLPELKELRLDHMSLEERIISSYDREKINPFSGSAIEVKGRFKDISAEKFGINLYSEESIENNDHLILLNSKSNEIIVGGEKAKIKDKLHQKDIDFHIFIDKSVLEVFINYQHCITNRIYLKSGKDFNISPISFNGEFLIKRLDIWKMNQARFKYN
jgi:beta-fructofuranosidase